MKELTWLTLIFIALITACSDRVNEREYLASGWLFKTDSLEIGESQRYYQNNYHRQDWEVVDIPHHFAREYDGTGWYAIAFTIPGRLQGKNVALVFEGVDDRAKVFIDGRERKKQWLANMPFYVLLDTLNKDDSHLLVLEIEDTGGDGGVTGSVYLQSFEKEENLLKSEFHDLQALPAPDWIQNGAIYELYIRAFSKEGTFKSIIPHLPEIQDLGVSSIWLMPIFPTGKDKRKGTLGSPYAIKDYFEVNPEFGTKEDFSDLVNAIHNSGMKVILDIACNHTAWDNKLIYDHPEWYTHDKRGNIISPNRDWTDVADLDYSNNDLKEYMWKVLEYWVRNFDVDGYRLDVAELVPLDFWEEAYRRLKKIKPDLLMLAEGADPELHIRGFHLTYSWNVYWTFYQIFRNDIPASVLEYVMSLENKRFPLDALRMRFSENHDQQRSAAFFGTRQAKVADILIFTLPGVPLIYAGQEFGETIKASLFEKSQLSRSANYREWYDFFTEIAKIRKSSSVLRTGKYIPLKNSQPEEIFSFLRKSGNETVMIACNLKDKPAKVSFYLDKKVLNLSHISIISSHGIDPGKVNDENNGFLLLKPFGWIIAKL